MCMKILLDLVCREETIDSNHINNSHSADIYDIYDPVLDEWMVHKILNWRGKDRIYLVH